GGRRAEAALADLDQRVAVDRLGDGTPDIWVRQAGNGGSGPVEEDESELHRDTGRYHEARIGEERDGVRRSDIGAVELTGVQRLCRLGQIPVEVQFDAIEPDLVLPAPVVVVRVEYEGGSAQ